MEPVVPEANQAEILLKASNRLGESQVKSIRLRTFTETLAGSLFDIRAAILGMGESFLGPAKAESGENRGILRNGVTFTIRTTYLHSVFTKGVSTTCVPAAP